MATLLAETQWHGNPRPVTAYASTTYVEQVESAYYNDRRDVPSFNHYVTPFPLEDLAPAATPGEAGPAVLVDFKLDGLWVAPTALTILLTLVGNDNISTTINFGPDVIGPVEAAALVAAEIAILGAGSVLSNNDGQSVVVSAINATTSITITTLTVA
jgi:hypothetical protein